MDKIFTSIVEKGEEGLTTVPLPAKLSNNQPLNPTENKIEPRRNK